MTKPQRHSPRSAPPIPSGSINYRWLFASLILAAGIALAWCKIGVPLNYDEAVTIDYYASKPYRFIVTDYQLPNNHIGYSLLLHTWSLLIGDPVMVRPDTAVLRVPSLALFTLGVAAFFLVCRRLLTPDPLAGAAATFFFICQPGVLDYALRLRGYGPSVAWLCLVLALVAYHDRLARWFFAAALAATLFIFDYTLPSNLWFSPPLGLGIGLWPLWGEGQETGDNKNIKTKLREGAWFYAALAAGFLATFLAYLPIREQLARHSNFQHTLSVMAHSLFINGPRHARLALEANNYGHSAWITGALVLAGLAAIIDGARRRRPEARRAALLITTTLVLFPITASLLSSTGYERNYVALAPVVALTCAWGMKGLLRLAAAKASQAFAAKWAPFAAPALLLLLASGHGIRHLAYYSRDFMPDKIAHYVAENFPNTGLLFGWDADPQAMVYYTKVEGIRSSSCFYDQVQRDVLEKLPRVLILAGEPEAQKIMDYFDIHGARYKIERLTDFARLNLYQATRIT